MWILLPFLAATAAWAGVYSDEFSTDLGRWEGGTVADGVLSLSGEEAVLDLGPLASLQGTLHLRQRSASALRLRLGELTWMANYNDDGGISLDDTLWPFPPAHRSLRTEADPVLEPDPSQAWEAGSVLHCEIAYDDSTATWLLFYTGVMSPGYGYRQVGLATSPDGKTWTRDPANPVLSIDYDHGTIDGIHVHMPTVVRDGAGTWQMYYACYQNDVGNRICHASSPDGRIWTPLPEDGGRLALDRGEAGAFDDDSLREPDVSIADDGTFYMLYVGTRADEHYGPAGLARSLDGGTTWERVSQVSEAESELQGGTVLSTPYGLEQWYQCNDAFCAATADPSDWTDWTMDPDPVLTKGWATWNSGYIQAPSALLQGAVVHLWFNAYDYGTGLEVLGHARSVPLPDQWVEVGLDWDGARLAVRFDGGPALEAALEPGAVAALILSTDGQAELDEIELSWESLPQEDTGVVDTAPPDTGGPGEVQDTGEEGAEDTAMALDSPTAAPAEEGCGCGGAGRAGLLWLGLVAMGASRRRWR